MHRVSLNKAAAVGVAACALAAAGDSSAQVVTSGCASPTSCTLTELFAGGFIQVDDKQFKYWGLEKLDHSFGAAPDFDVIAVEGISALGDPDPLDPGPGIRFVGNGELAVSGVQYLDLRLDFRALSTSTDHVIKDASVQAEIYSGSGNARFAVNEYLANWTGSTGMGQMIVTADFGFLEATPPTSDDIEFAPQGGLYVEKNFYLEGTDPGASVQLDALEQRYSQQLPEPGASLMLGCGAALVSLLPRRRPLR